MVKLLVLSTIGVVGSTSSHMPDGEDSLLQAQTRRSQCDPEKDGFPNVGWALSGYNIFYGNPLSDSVGVDPGFKLPVFKSDYSACERTQDHKFIRPQGLHIRQESGCTSSFRSKVLSSADDYEDQASDSMTIGASVEVPGKGGGKFGMSSGMKAELKSFLKSTTKTIISSVECVVFSMNIASGKEPDAAPGFKNVVERTEDESSWHTLFDDFGTHYVTQVKMGSRFGYSSKIEEKWSGESNSAETSSSVELAAAATSAAEAEAKGSFEGKSESSNARVNDFKNNMQDKRTISLGKPLQGDDDDSSWMERVSKFPMPIKYSTKVICEHPLFQSGESASKRQPCKNALDNYCEYLQSKNPALDCSNTHVTPACQWDEDCHGRGGGPGSKFCRIPTHKPAPRHIPFAKRCKGYTCNTDGQFCPPAVPGSGGAGYCCEGSEWKEGNDCWKTKLPALLPHTPSPRARECVEPPMCGINMFASSNFQGDEVQLKVTPECKGGTRTIWTNQAACVYEMKNFAKNMVNEIDSIQAYGACHKVVLVDQDQCSYYSSENVIEAGEFLMPNIKQDLEEDICKIIVLVKPLP